MGMILSPEPGIYSGSSITVNISKTSDVTEFAVTKNGIPPVIAKYIAYDQLSPPNPFIATVEDGLGNILLDGGFPKWYNDFGNPAWTTYSDLSPSFKYLYDAIDFISNKTKVAAGNKKILVLGDQDFGYHYCVKDAGEHPGGFNNTITKICSIKGYQPTFKTRSDYGGQLNCDYAELDQYCCVLFFSTVYTSERLITNEAIASLVSYRENKNGIFFITDHGDRDLTSVSEAIDSVNAGFYKTANLVVANFGCYFSGYYDRTPVNVGFLRANYGDHPLWTNLLNTDEIRAGGSESKVVVTEYPLYSDSITLGITEDSYIPVKFLMRMSNGSVQSSTYTYGKNVPEVLYFLNRDNSRIETNTKETFLKTHFTNIQVAFSSDVNGILKINSTPVGTFNYDFEQGTVSKSFYSGYNSDIPVNDNDIFYIQMTNPLSYTKGLKIDFIKPTFNIRVNKGIMEINKYEFEHTESSSPFRNLNKLVCDKNISTQHFSNSFKYRKIIDYFS